MSESLGQRLFRRRVSLIGGLDELLRLGSDPDGARDPQHHAAHELRSCTADHLHRIVTGMNLGNFMVKQHRKWVENYRDREAWDTVDRTQLAEISEHLSGLPSAERDSDEDAKRFDLLVLNAQLCVLEGQDLTTYRDTIREIADSLLSQTAIPAIHEQQHLLRALTEPEWWSGVTLPMLEQARRKVRGLVRLLERVKRKPVYTDFADELGASVEHTLPVTPGVDRKRFLQKVRTFLQEHEDHVALQRLRRNRSLTASDFVSRRGRRSRRPHPLDRRS